MRFQFREGSVSERIDRNWCVGPSRTGPILRTREPVSRVWHGPPAHHVGAKPSFHLPSGKLALDWSEVHDVVESRVMFRTGRIKVLSGSLTDDELLRELRRLSDEPSDD